MKRCFINSSFAIHPNGILGDDGIMHACEPDYKSIITDANQRRRMSRIVKMGVAAALLCLQQEREQKIDAIITATGLGCLSDTEKFMNTLLDNDEQLLNPTAFIQSTFNVVGAQIALLTNNHAYNNTYAHRALSFESALLDAMLHINEGAENVLIGAIDEATIVSQAIMQRLGLLNNICMGEGAQFFVLSNRQIATPSTEIVALKTFTGTKASEEIIANIKLFLSENQLNEKDIDILMLGENGHKAQDQIYAKVKEDLFSSSTPLTFKDICGEYHTASSYGIYKACNYLGNKEIQIGSKLLLHNHYNNINHSLILLNKC